MNTNVIPMFAYNDKQLRGVKIDGEPWFVAKDVFLCLGLSTGNTSHHLSKLEADEKGKGIFLTPGGPQRLVTISRPGLLKLIARSSKPEAKAFDRWVRHEVLPQIMDNGGYVARDADVAAVVEAAPDNKARTDLDLMKTVMSAMQAMQERITELETEAEVAAPKVAFVDQYVSAKGNLAFDTVARTLGLGCAKELCALLRLNDVLFYRKIGGQNINVARKVHLDAGRFCQRTFNHSGGVSVQTRVTAAGVEWLAEQLPKFIGKRAEFEARDARNADSRARIAAAIKAA